MESLENILIHIRRAAWQLNQAIEYANSDEGGNDAHAYDDIQYRRDYLEEYIRRYQELRSLQ
jgi:hypothetical protein